MKIALTAAVILAPIAPVNAQQVSQEQASVSLVGKLVERVNDNGLVIEVVVRCSRKTAGIMHYDKSARLLLSSKGGFHADFLTSWMSTCNVGTVLD